MSADHSGEIPRLALEAFARSFHREACSYGFTGVDYLRFVNHLFERILEGEPDPEVRPGPAVVSAGTRADLTLPLMGHGVALERYLEARHGPVLRRWLAGRAGRYFAMSRTTAERLDAERLIRDPETALGVIATPDGSPLGIAAYFGLDRAQDRAELRVMVGEASLRADELLEEAVRLWVRYGIEELGLRKIVASLLGADLLGVRVHQRLGFDLEGVFRDEVALDDGFHDVVRMALLSPPQV